ncbi:hypothetical protein NHQ30_010865 [Ciborinia camelliae]|nr:hypothetical protein NHQ30_010865 [Ciborinia camelliae]
MKVAIPVESMNRCYSEDDWNEEASKMCFVYSNTAFNIAAVAATNGDDGFLSDRLVVKLGHVLRPDGKTIARSLWIRPCLRNTCHERKDIKLLRFSLFRRAWVLQENILAARTLVFCPVGMHFRCRVKQRSDQNPFDDVKHLGVFNGMEHAVFPNLLMKSAICSKYVMDV